MCINYPHTHIYLYTHAGEDGALAVYSSGVPASQPIICPLMGAWGAHTGSACLAQDITSLSPLTHVPHVTALAQEGVLSTENGKDQRAR